MVSILGLILFLVLPLAAAAYDIPETGFATLTHYDLPNDYIASCGCVGRVTSHPTAAINALAYGSTTSFGPACGYCFALSLLNTPTAALPRIGPDGANWGGDGMVLDPETAPSVVVKIVDLCPNGPPWCNATEEQGNMLGSKLHFDLAWPSKAIPNNWFPGDHDYGVWNISYSSVPCTQWSGHNDASAQGSDWIQELSACCPSDPLSTDTTCPSYLDTLTSPSIAALVPNTSNPLSKGAHDGQSNGAASTLQIGLGGGLVWERRADGGGGGAGAGERGWFPPLLVGLGVGLGAIDQAVGVGAFFR